MTVEEKLTRTLSDGETPVVQGTYLGSAERYIAFNLISNGAGYGDDLPTALFHLIEVRYVCPATESSLSARKEIANRLAGAGFTFPRVSFEANAGGKQSWVFETEIATGTDWEA